MIDFDKPGFLYEVEQYARLVADFNAAQAHADQIKLVMLAQRKHLKNLLDGKPTVDPTANEIVGPTIP